MVSCFNINLFNFLKIFLSIFFVIILSSCSLDIKPPNIPISSQTIENPIANKDYVKQSTDFNDKISKQSDLNKINNWEDLKDFLENNLSSDNPLIYPDETGPTLATLNYGKFEAKDKIKTIKTDGQYIYLLLNSSIFIIEAYPLPDSKLLAEIKFKDRPHDFFISNNRLTILGDNYLDHQNTEYENNYFYLKIFDTSEKNNPKELRHLDIEGDYSDSQFIDKHLYLVSEIDSFTYLEGNTMLPQIIENNKNINCQLDKECLVPEIYYFDTIYNHYNLVSINSINIQDNTELIKNVSYILPRSKKVFLLGSSLYLSYAKQLGESHLKLETMMDLLYLNLSDKGKQKINTIKLSKDFILNNNEKQNKLLNVLEAQVSSLSTLERNNFYENLKKAMAEKYKKLSAELEKTIIHKIDLEQGNIRYANSGEVGGYLSKTQTLINEKKNILFIGTSKNYSQLPYTEEKDKIVNTFYALDEDLKLLGELEGLAKNKQVNSIYLAEDRAYLSTNEQEDYLFVIDSSNPANIKILGDLSLSENLNYLHPYDKTTLMALGENFEKDENDKIISNGLKLSLFDISDIQNINEIDRQILGGEGSNSSVLNDHQSFLFSRNKNLLAFPISIKNSKGGIFGNQDFDGIVIFNVGSEGFSLKGLIDHQDISPSQTKDNSSDFVYSYKGIKKSLYINDAFYSFSDYGMKINSLKDLNSLKSFSFDNFSKTISNNKYIINTY